MIKGIYTGNLQKWQRIVGFVKLDDYPSLPCPYCNEEQLCIDTESLQFRKLPEGTAAKTSRKYQSEKSISAEQAQSTSQQIMASESNFFLKFLLAAGTYHQYTSNPANGEPNLFCGFFSCQNCQQSVTASGLYMRSFSLDKKEKPPAIKVEHFSPTVPIVSVSTFTPDSIQVELNDAFKHFHFDPASSASKLRRAIESFCDDMQVKGKGLHQRICSLKEHYPEIAEYLEPLKLVGNEGTHAHDVTEIDLLHAFEIFKFVLEIYDRKARYIATRDNYEQLVHKFGSDKIQLAIENKNQLTETPS